MVHKWGISCTGTRATTNPVQKRVFSLHQKSSPAENGAQIGHFLHREPHTPKEKVHKLGIFCTGINSRE